MKETSQGSLSPLGNFAALGASELVARIIGFFATALLARKLSVEGFGILGFATAMISYFGVALTAGFGDIGAREVARDPAAARRIAADGTGIRLLIAAAGMAATALIAFTFISSPLQRFVLLLSTLSLVTLALDTTWVYRGLARNRTAASALLVAQLAYLAGVIALVSRPDDVVRVPLIQFAGDLLAALLLLALLLGRGIPRPSLTGGMRLLRQSGSITIARLLRTLIVTFDVLLLGLLSGSREVGLYTAAYRICMLVVMVAVATHVVFLPRVARAALEGRMRLSDALTHSLSLTSAVILPLVVGGIAVAEPLLALLFGAEYGAAANPLRLLLASIAILSIHATAHNVFVALHQTGREAAIFAVAAAVNVVLNFVLIPPYGLMGAAFATVAAEALILIASAIALYVSGLRPRSSRLLLPLLASAVMGTALHAISGRFPVWILIPLGGLVYVFVLFATGGLSRVLREAGAGED